MKALFRHRYVVWFECFILAVAIPTIIIHERLAQYMFAFLWGATIYGAIMYRYVLDHDYHSPWQWEKVNWDNLKPILMRFGISAVMMLVFISIYDPEKRFGLIQARPDIWVLMLFVYPLLSALPQEFIFCTYFFKRYKPIFRSERARVIASTIVFAYAHVLFINPVAPLLSLIGGYFFATTYHHHRSLALVTIEHALYGIALFTCGLGWYFWGGALRGDQLMH